MDASTNTGKGENALALPPNVDELLHFARQAESSAPALMRNPTAGARVRRLVGGIAVWGASGPDAVRAVLGLSQEMRSGVPVDEELVDWLCTLVALLGTVGYPRRGAVAKAWAYEGDLVDAAELASLDQLRNVIFGVCELIAEFSMDGTELASDWWSPLLTARQAILNQLAIRSAGGSRATGLEDAAALLVEAFLRRHILAPASYIDSVDGTDLLGNVFVHDDLMPLLFAVLRNNQFFAQYHRDPSALAAARTDFAVRLALLWSLDRSDGSLRLPPAGVFPPSRRLRPGDDWDHVARVALVWEPTDSVFDPRRSEERGRGDIGPTTSP